MQSPGLGFAGYKGTVDIVQEIDIGVLSGFIKAGCRRLKQSDDEQCCAGFACLECVGQAMEKELYVCVLRHQADIVLA